MKKFLIIQTAFIGDVILTIPVITALKNKYQDAIIDFMCIPNTKDLLLNNPYINKIIVYDKHVDKGFSGLIKRIKKIRKENYDYVISPHRSFRSAFMSYFSKSKNTIGFDNSSLNFLFKNKIKYLKGIHEIQRNLKLLEPVGIREDKIIKPEFFISELVKKNTRDILSKSDVTNKEKFIVAAPGSVWYTKRLPEEKFIKVFNILSHYNYKIFTIGSPDEYDICEKIIGESVNKNIFNLAGKLSLPETIELIRCSEVLLTNDSAPLHMANAVETNVVAVFGATVPKFGFFPYGKDDVIIETNGLECRPCAIHGSNKCPIKTFVCMKKIPEEEISGAVLKFFK